MTFQSREISPRQWLSDPALNIRRLQILFLHTSESLHSLQAWVINVVPVPCLCWHGASCCRVLGNNYTVYMMYHTNLVRNTRYQQLPNTISKKFPFRRASDRVQEDISIISQHWDGIGSWKPSLWKTRTDKTIAADDMATSMFELIISSHHKN